MDNAQIGFNVLAGLGQCGPLTLIVALVQFTAPHAFLSTATGLGFSARAIGGAFGSAVSMILPNRCKLNKAETVHRSWMQSSMESSSHILHRLVMQLWKLVFQNPLSQTYSRHLRLGWAYWMCQA